MTHLTIRNVPPELAEALETARREHGWSLNRTVLELLSAALGVAADAGYDNGLGRHAGTWTEAEGEAFDAAVAPFEGIDDELWR
jgi:hypothetical protein